jgi:pimeloyl-ACP methyl ester carboxylesterase
MQRLPPPPMPPWLEAMVPFRRYRVDIGDHRMHVMESGEGLPVLLIHGNPSWGFLYRRVAEVLKDEPLRLIMPDLVGLGFSDKPLDAREHRLENHQRWMAAFIEQLDVDRCVMAIQDWGGAIGVGALSQLQDQHVGLVVMNTVVTPPKKNFKATAFHRFSNMPIVSDAAFRWLGFPQSVMASMFGESLVGDVARAYRYPLRDRSNNVAPLALARMVPSSHDHASIAPLQRCQDWVERFDGPAAIVWGDRDPVLGRVRGWMEKLFPQAPVTRTNASHFLQEEVPHEIADAIRQVADKVRA